VAKRVVDHLEIVEIEQKQCKRLGHGCGISFPHLRWPWPEGRGRGVPFAAPLERGKSVEAPDAERAIRQAIKDYGITDPEQRKRLAAYRVG